ncbi:FtsW/RodA/SpoVE family cell cycle protein [Deinococcus lacus]|uniref:FtsW/RodA/SpoVE family cell cycle protein n=1 Tax=Deinococcus lacus TaxID=392561 RepID=A0ABW1Y9D7_9DEIO
MILLTTVLILLEPDLGSSVLTFALGIVLMYTAGVRIGNIAGLLLALTLASLPLVSWYLERNPYIRERWFGHVERTDGVPAEVGLDQIGKAHRDLANGGLWGLGPDGPRYDYFADHTDLIIASIGFSNGLIGVLTVIFAYWLIVMTALQVAQLATRVRPMARQIHGASIMAVGAMFMLVGQAVVNLLVAAGWLPVTGIPLPLVSYGFTSMLTMSIALGIIHSALREVRRALETPPAPPQPPAEPEVAAVPAEEVGDDLAPPARAAS